MLVMYSRPGCHLCDVMLAELQPLLDQLGIGVKVVDISGEADLMRRFSLKIPVLTLDGKLLCQFRLDAARVREAVNSRLSS